MIPGQILDELQVRGSNLFAGSVLFFHFTFCVLLSAKRCPEDADCKFRPNEDEDSQQHYTDSDSVLDIVYLPYNKLTH